MQNKIEKLLRLQKGKAAISRRKLKGKDRRVMKEV
jgi:hypothetical protein